MSSVYVHLCITFYKVSTPSKNNTVLWKGRSRSFYLYPTFLRRRLAQKHTPPKRPSISFARVWTCKKHIAKTTKTINKNRFILHCLKVRCCIVDFYSQQTWVFLFCIFIKIQKKKKLFVQNIGWVWQPKKKHQNKLTFMNFTTIL